MTPNVIMPAVPTETMLFKGYKIELPYYAAPIDRVRETYSAMLSARPMRDEAEIIAKALHKYGEDTSPNWTGMTDWTEYLDEARYVQRALGLFAESGE